MMCVMRLVLVAMGRTLPPFLSNIVYRYPIFVAAAISNSRCLHRTTVKNAKNVCINFIPNFLNYCMFLPRHNTTPIRTAIIHG